MRVEMLSGGWFTTSAAIWRRGEDPERRLRFPVPAYLIETGEERILVDTGMHPEIVADRQRRYGAADSLALFELELGPSVAEQVGARPLTKIVLTHLHFDHAGGLDLLPRSVPVFLQRREWEAGNDAAAVARNFYLPADYAGISDRVVLVDGDRDLLGDGSVQLLSTPGHTPGHQSVRIGEELVIGGDVTHFAAGLDDHRFPVVGDDFEAQAASAERLKALREAGLAVRPGHDPEVLAPGLLLG